MKLKEYLENQSEDCKPISVLYFNGETLVCRNCQTSFDKAITEKEVMETIEEEDSIEVWVM